MLIDNSYELRNFSLKNYISIEKDESFVNNKNCRKGFFKFCKGWLVLLIVFFLNMLFMHILWFGNGYENLVLKFLVVNPSIQTSFNMWRSPPVTVKIFIHVFNYTNTDKALNGTELLKVQEIGPYVFREKLERVNIKFDANGKVSFQEKKTILFLLEESVGNLNDEIYIPNVPLMVALKKIKTYNIFIQNLYNIINSPLIYDTKMFPKVKVNDLIWGYDDNFYSFIRNMKQMITQNETIKFGLLSEKIGVQKTVITAETGSENIENIGKIFQINGKNRIGAWDNSQCDELYASDGTIFSAASVKGHRPLNIYIKDTCRRLQIEYNKSLITENEFNAVEYHFSQNIFKYGENYQDNSCYKYDNELPPDGFFYVGPCLEDVPIYISFPHFWKSQANERHLIEGLRPNSTIHNSKIIIHEDLGLTLKVDTKLQLNIRLHKSKFAESYNFGKVKDGTIMPVAWINMNTGSLSPDFIKSMKYLTWIKIKLKFVLQMITIIVAIVTGVFLYYYCLKLSFN